MAKSTFHPDPIHPSGGGIVTDSTPVISGEDPLTAGMTDAEKRDLDLAEARKMLAALKGAAFEIPTLGSLVKPFEDRLERADRFHLDAEDADRAVTDAKRTRDAHEAAALRVPNGNPVATAAGAQKTLDEALKRAEDTNRLANTTVMIARNDALAARTRIRRDYRANADRLTRERLRTFEAERTAAIEAVREAQRRIHRAMSAYGVVRGMANQLPEDNHMRTLVSRSRFDPSARRSGSNQPTLEAVLQQLETVPSRFGYGDDRAPRAYPVIGASFGEAVKIATEECAAANSDSE
ncbi:hypothetical protein NE857_30540 [Nocardiopsis exhalans]|uniref:Uncharacterized protein n=1 Tax=Nocardiopsis exhalans TaxID=163604 RepID=A0ABY5D8Z0_9ACTN|nr:hypothetical protein [Nocardiopsis exhalans]USY19528.1 hypothetical protein NE857_30540 [Nocardiopsis exhalans]